MSSWTPGFAVRITFLNLSSLGIRILDALPLFLSSQPLFFHTHQPCRDFLTLNDPPLILIIAGAVITFSASAPPSVLLSCGINYRNIILLTHITSKTQGLFAFFFPLPFPPPRFRFCHLHIFFVTYPFHHLPPSLPTRLHHISCPHSTVPLFAK